MGAGRGTTVSVFLPRAAAVPAEPPAARPAEAGEQRTNRAMVLVVDDDAAVRGTTAEILAGLGYTVLQAAGGEAAMELLGQGGTVDVLLTDVVMPGVSGPELARRGPRRSAAAADRLHFGLCRRRRPRWRRRAAAAGPQTVPAGWAARPDRGGLVPVARLGGVTRLSDSASSLRATGNRGRAGRGSGSRSAP
jgi:hypothetical protein